MGLSLDFHPTDITRWHLSFFILLIINVIYFYYEIVQIIIKIDGKILTLFERISFLNKSDNCSRLEGGVSQD